MNKKLKMLRLEKELTQESVAFELGISQKAYSKIENGKVCISKDKMLKLAKLFNVSPDHFCEISCECTSFPLQSIEKIKEYLSQKGIEIPNFLK